MGNKSCGYFPLAVVSVRSFLRGLAVFDLIRHQLHGDDAVLIAFDLIELDGEDLPRTPIEHASCNERRS
jgi:hypothetical protein